MLRIVIVLSLNFFLFNSLFGISGNASRDNVRELVGTSSLENASLSETGVSIIKYNIYPSTYCLSPNGSIEIVEIAKDGVTEDISNFDIHWYDHYENILFKGPTIRDLSPGTYLVSVVHKESGVESDRWTFVINDESYRPLISVFVMDDTNCDLSNPNGRLEVYVHEPSHHSEFGFTWFSGPSNDPSQVLPSNTYVLDQVPAGIYTVEVVDHISGCATYSTIRLTYEISMPQLNYSVSHNTSCTSNGELQITEITEFGSNHDLHGYDYTLYDSEQTPIMNGSPLFTGLSAGTYYLSATNSYTHCSSGLVEATIINDYDGSEASSEFSVVGPNPDFSRCGIGPMTLEAQDGEHFRWYESETDDKILHDGAAYTIENLLESRSIWVAAYDPICGIESDRKALSLKVISLPLITSLASNVEQATLNAQVDGTIKWYLNDEVIEGENEHTIMAPEDGSYTIEVSNGHCQETKSINFSGLSFSKAENLITAPNIPNSTYLWSFNGTVIDEETIPTLSVSKNGIYSVKIFYGNTSGKPSEAKILDYTIEVADFDTVTGLESSYEDQNVKIYPIPFKNSITIEFSREMRESFTLRIWDTNGRIIIDKKLAVLKDKKITLSVPDLDKGFYILEASDSRRSFISRLIK